MAGVETVHVDLRRSKVTVVINQWQCRCLDGRLLVEEGGGGGRERTEEEATWRRKREKGGRERGTFGAEGRCGDGARCFKSGRFACAEENWVSVTFPAPRPSGLGIRLTMFSLAEYTLFVVP